MFLKQTTSNTGIYRHGVCFHFNLHLNHVSTNMSVITVQEHTQRLAVLKNYLPVMHTSGPNKHVAMASAVSRASESSHLA